MTTMTLEAVRCYLCGSRASREFMHAEDDLGGTPGRFRFVRCLNCGLAYQNPRVPLDRIGAYYDDTYIAHRKKRNWGVLTPLFERAMNKLDADKAAIVSRYIELGPASEVLDVGCAVGTFLAHLQKTHRVRATGVDFKDLSAAADAPGRRVPLRPLLRRGPRGEPFRSGHDVALPRARLRSDAQPRDRASRAEARRHDGHRSAAARQPHVRVVRRPLARAAGAATHGPLRSRSRCSMPSARCGFDVVDYLPYGAFPAYFYLFTGAAFRLLKGRGLNLDRAIVPYFIGQLLALPLTLFERRLNLAMQTVICRRPL